jgi:hypothetical protein
MKSINSVTFLPLLSAFTTISYAATCIKGGSGWEVHLDLNDYPSFDCRRFWDTLKSVGCPKSEQIYSFQCRTNQSKMEMYFSFDEDLAKRCDNISLVAGVLTGVATDGKNNRHGPIYCKRD